MQPQIPYFCRKGNVRCVRDLAVQEGSDVTSKGLEGVRGLGVIIGQEEGADAVVKSVVQRALALEGIAFAKGTGFKEEADYLEMAAEASLPFLSALLLTKAVRWMGVASHG